MDAGFFKGVPAEQDGRFKDKKKKLLKSMKFGESLSKKVDMDLIHLESLRPWITKRITELLGFEDEVVCDYVFNQLESQHPDPKDIQMNITGFLNSKNARLFLTELWDLLLSAMECGGIPAVLKKAYAAVDEQVIEKAYPQTNFVKAKNPEAGDVIPTHGNEQTADLVGGSKKNKDASHRGRSRSSSGSSFERRRTERQERRKKAEVNRQNARSKSSSSSERADSIEKPRQIERDNKKIPSHVPESDRRRKPRRRSRSRSRDRHHDRSKNDRDQKPKAKECEIKKSKPEKKVETPSSSSSASSEDSSTTSSGDGTDSDTSSSSDSSSSSAVSPSPVKPKKSKKQADSTSLDEHKMRQKAIESMTRNSSKPKD